MELGLLPSIAWYTILFLSGWKITKKAILSSRQSFIDAGLKGNDMGRADRPLVCLNKKWIKNERLFQVAESLGLISAVVFLVLSVISLVFSGVEDLTVNCGALLTIMSAAFLGFIDDVLTLKWRHKLWAPGRLMSTSFPW